MPGAGSAATQLEGAAGRQAGPPGQQQPRANDVRTGLAVQWLGTSSGAPTQHRNVSSILLLQRRRVLMVDAGEGTARQLSVAGIDPALIAGWASRAFLPPFLLPPSSAPLDRYPALAWLPLHRPTAAGPCERRHR